MNKSKAVFWIALLFLLSYILKVDLVIPLLLVVAMAYLKILYPNIKQQNYNLLNLSLLFVSVFVLSYLIIQRKFPVYYLPFSVLPMLAMILFGELKIALLLAVVSAVSVSSVAGNNYAAMLLFLIGGIACSLLVRNVHRRSSVIRAGFITGLIQAAALFLIDHFIVTQPAKYLILLANGIISSIIVVETLPIFEYLFNTTTNISLLELTDFNHPLLQRLVIEAPGTYHHSLVVGNLSEAACQIIGANPMLARLGAYYHDIGKLTKPDYFIENQRESKHDTLSPTMSKLVIMNHVKEGIELAKKYRLKKRLIDFIQQHHGTSLVYYFYLRALEHLEDDQEIKEEGFRYPGPKPNSKEAAVVLLADSVEAATRALDDPEPAKIEEVVHKIINNKFIDGQLDECDLALKDLEKISAVFVRILHAIYHSRVIYPENAKTNHNHKKPAKENPYPSQDGQDDKKGRA